MIGVDARKGRRARRSGGTSAGESTPTLFPLPEIPETVLVSARSARLRFHGCDPDYIRDVCRAACCRSTVAPSGVLIAVLPAETVDLERRGATVRDGLLEPAPGTRRCTFEDPETHLCGLHGTGAKPFGCVASPFTLTRRDTLIVRNRYKLLRCYAVEPRLPAYVAFRSSLELLLGRSETERVVDWLDRGGGDLRARILPEAYLRLRALDGIRRSS